MRVEVVTASAGTGKTTRLTRTYTEAVADGTAPEAIVATTFTRKAAAELTERVRAALVATRPEAAHQVLASPIGTIDSLCARLVTEFALDLGLSPDLKVIDESEQGAFFNAAIDSVVERHAGRLQRPAYRLGIEDWREQVRQIVDAARPNAIGPDALRDCARLSWARLESLLEPPAEGAALDAGLEAAITAAREQFQGAREGLTKTTSNALAVVDEAAQALAARGELSWQQWAKLAKLKLARDGDALLPVCEAASHHPRHPRLREDMKVFIEGLFTCAAEALERYDRVKAAEGAVDFVDVEVKALELLEHPRVRAALKERLGLSLVDEFQDTSPLQLALFVRLGELVGRSVWVGDHKQAIYGFRGTDPELVYEVAETLPQPGEGGRDRLAENFRSRPEIVRFVNDLFGAAFPATGILKEDVVVEPRRDGAPGMGAPLQLWRLSGRNVGDACAALAGGVKRVLAEGWLVQERDGRLRPARGSDIAILCRTNTRCDAVAQALAAQGLKVAIPRQGLLDTPEATLALAALRYLLDPRDTLALAQIVHLHPEGIAEGAWLESWLEQGPRAVAERVAPVRALDEARERLPHLTPVQALELAIAVARLPEAVVRWGDPRQRLANLDNLRGLAQRYQDMAEVRRCAATAAGLVTFLLQEVKGAKDVDCQAASPDPDAVSILSYHCAKGLEWPVTILFDLDFDRERGVFGLHVEADTRLDPTRPLAGRRLRYWPWPYGQQGKDVGLDAVAAATEEARRVAARDHAESTRLLYVGMTRARDYLILAARKKTTWLDTLGNPQARPIMALPEAEGGQEVAVADGRHRITVHHLAVPEEEEIGTVAERLYAAPPAPEPRPAYPPLRLVPSAAEADASADVALEAPQIIEIGGRLPLVGQPDMTALGEAVHAFLAADRPHYDARRCLDLAGAILRRWQVTALAPEHLIEASDRLRRFLDERYPGARWRREVPVQGRRGLQRVEGRIDLLLDTGDGFILLDHKSFPGRFEQWPAKAASFRPQMDLYAEILAAATGKAVQAKLIHMPIVGVVALLA